MQETETTRAEIQRKVGSNRKNITVYKNKRFS